MSSSLSENYQIVYYADRKGREPVRKYINDLPRKEQQKVYAHLEFLRERGGYVDEPYARHITGKIRELRVGFSRNRHRIFYFAAAGRQIVLLHAFVKKTPRTPKTEIEKAVFHYKDFITNQK